MTAREAMLAAIRRAGVPAAPAAVVPTAAAARPIDDLRREFLASLAQVGATAELCRRDRTAAVVAERAAAGGAMPGVIAARFGVAENGAVYVDAADLDERSAVVRSEHLVVTLSSSGIVPTMHEAMRRIPRDSRCGWFLSGPSKTADIEQALVVGAQGARTMHLLLLL